MHRKLVAVDVDFRSHCFPHCFFYIFHRRRKEHAQLKQVFRAYEILYLYTAMVSIYLCPPLTLFPQDFTDSWLFTVSSEHIQFLAFSFFFVYYFSQIFSGSVR